MEQQKHTPSAEKAQKIQLARDISDYFTETEWMIEKLVGENESLDAVSSDKLIVILSELRNLHEKVGHFYDQATTQSS